MPPKGKPAVAEGLIRPAVLNLVRGIVVIALGLSAYLAWASLAGGGVAGCGPESGCDKVLRSRYAYWLGVPVSLIAVLLYAGLLAATFRLGRGAPAEAQRQTWRALVPIAVAILGAALWFVGLQFIVIKAVCPFCMGAHACGAAVALLLLANAPFRDAPEKPWQVEKQVFVPPALGRRLALGGVAGIVLLVAGQALHQRRAFEVKSLAGGATVEPKAKADRFFAVHGGAVQLNLHEVPVIGPPDAPHVMLSLFDYTCHHCRLMHAHLMAAHRALSNRLAIVSLPMPLDPQCNFTVTRTHPDHVNACEFARLGLAVWRADRTKHERFEDWMFAPDRPPPPREARAFAEQLVGTNALARAWDDPWVTNAITLGVRLYATNYYGLGRGNMPQLILGTNIVTGNLRGPEDLYSLLAVNLGLTFPPAPATTPATR
jgi:uncharacterized membrane protein